MPLSRNATKASKTAVMWVSKGLPSRGTDVGVARSRIRTALGLRCK